MAKKYLYYSDSEDWSREEILSDTDGQYMLADGDIVKKETMTLRRSNKVMFYYEETPHILKMFNYSTVKYKFKKALKELETCENFLAMTKVINIAKFHAKQTK